MDVRILAAVSFMLAYYGRDCGARTVDAALWKPEPCLVMLDVIELTRNKTAIATGSRAVLSGVENSCYTTDTSVRTSHFIGLSRHEQG